MWMTPRHLDVGRKQKALRQAGTPSPNIFWIRRFTSSTHFIALIMPTRRRATKMPNQMHHLSLSNSNSDSTMTFARA